MTSCHGTRFHHVSLSNLLRLDQCAAGCSRDDGDIAGADSRSRFDHRTAARDLRLDPVRYASFNLWATLIGATFCLFIGPLIDRYGTRIVLTGVALLLGGSVSR